jgi:N6-L-threonylcarbamoyladenine synthase
LAYKLINAAKQKWVHTVLLAGWVSANNRLRSVISEWAKEEWFEFLYPSKNLYCMDNAAMVGMNTYYKVKYGKFEEKVGVIDI